MGERQTCNLNCWRNYSVDARHSSTSGSRDTEQYRVAYYRDMVCWHYSCEALNLYFSGFTDLVSKLVFFVLGYHMSDWMFLLVGCLKDRLQVNWAEHLSVFMFWWGHWWVADGWRINFDHFAQLFGSKLLEKGPLSSRSSNRTPRVGGLRAAIREQVHAGQRAKDRTQSTEDMKKHRKTGKKSGPNGRKRRGEAETLNCQSGGCEEVTMLFHWGRAETRLMAYAVPSTIKKMGVSHDKISNDEVYR
ncbi:hypothetical protein MA16_Dca010308 [Dendrobium catenatum]|uniref:Uncharacterized protein n=1 Tax=Dendrobium catenatum TaxID=906689 RepID=A0A2I0W3F3_9ASPA|nr:hypothetical protein MA16_Dca010308 [Dendrobium catenatum]